MRTPRFVALASLLACAVLACSSTSTAPITDDDAGGVADASTCPGDAPSTCPTTAPSYAGDVAPILTERCAACHMGNGEEAASTNLGSYAAVFAERSAVQSEVEGCSMPPIDQPQLTAAERTTLLTWLVCDAPNN